MFTYLKNFISYWYMRYLLVTELFMVAKWERHMFHIIAVVLLTILGVINQSLVVGGVKLVRELYYNYNMRTLHSITDHFQDSSNTVTNLNNF